MFRIDQKKEADEWKALERVLNFGGFDTVFVELDKMHGPVESNSIIAVAKQLPAEMQPTQDRSTAQSPLRPS